MREEELKFTRIRIGLTIEHMNSVFGKPFVELNREDIIATEKSMWDQLVKEKEPVREALHKSIDRLIDDYFEDKEEL